MIDKEKWVTIEAAVMCQAYRHYEKYQLQKGQPVDVMDLQSGIARCIDMQTNWGMYIGMMAALQTIRERVFDGNSDCGGGSGGRAESVIETCGNGGGNGHCEAGNQGGGKSGG